MNEKKIHMVESLYDKTILKIKTDFFQSCKDKDKTKMPG